MAECGGARPGSLVLATSGERSLGLGGARGGVDSSPRVGRTRVSSYPGGGEGEGECACAACAGGRHGSARARSPAAWAVGLACDERWRAVLIVTAAAAPDTGGGVGGGGSDPAAVAEMWPLVVVLLLNSAYCGEWSLAAGSAAPRLRGSPTGVWAAPKLAPGRPREAGRGARCACSASPGVNVGGPRG